MQGSHLKALLAASAVRIPMVDPRLFWSHMAAVFAEVEQMSHLGREHGGDCHLPFLSLSVSAGLGPNSVLAHARQALTVPKLHPQLYRPVEMSQAPSQHHNKNNLAHTC